MSTFNLKGLSKLRIVPAVLLTMFVSGADICSAQRNTYPPEAEPVHNWIKASQTNDIELLKSTWTSQELELAAGEGINWKRYLNESAKFWRKTLGVRSLKRVRLEDIEYRVENQTALEPEMKVRVIEREKIVHVIYRGRERESFNVQYEDGRWKIPEK